MVYFSIGRLGNGSVSLYIGVVPGLKWPQVTDAIIVGDSATGLYDLWVYGPALESVEYHIVENAASLTYGLFTHSTSEPTGPHVLRWSTAPASQTLSYGYIVAQSLSPTSGYVRWDNGVQVAWARVGSGSFGAESGGAESGGAESGAGILNDPYRRSYTWTYPAAFAEAPTVQVAIETTTAALAAANVSAASSTSATVRAQYGGAPNTAFNVHIYAIGSWRV
ncbi:hypothetical protein CSW30_11230 [Thermus scotoductus]|uniref:Uncharacterized protein n=1 Tax=Thermus scotoductus TaxID=37636 RepID=A0A430UM85_THESC|nr:hypothetical protein CSW30_11230 [Thermus scotoductus]